MPEPISLAITRAHDFLLAESDGGFRGAWEIQAGYRGAPLLIGTVFPLAFVALALTHPMLGSQAARQVAEREAANIVDLGGPDGWRYFNLFPEIPPDADDLAHVIHLLTRLDWPDRQAILNDPLNFLEKNFHPDGSCNTWLVDDPAAAHQARRSWAGGDDLCHPEVLANLLAALAAHDPDRFASPLKTGARWLIQRAQARGWAAYWYWGWGYGSFQAIRALRVVAARWPDLIPEVRPTVQKVLGSLLERQSPEGAWAPERSPVESAAVRLPSILETAFSLEALAAAEDWAPTACRPAIRNAAMWLASQQRQDGSWEAEPLYFTLGRNAYQSREVTTAITLGALLTAKRLIEAIFGYNPS